MVHIVAITPTRQATLAVAPSTLRTDLAPGITLPRVVHAELAMNGTPKAEVQERLDLSVATSDDHNLLVMTLVHALTV
jgi:hypothetical protein